MKKVLLIILAIACTSCHKSSREFRLSVLTSTAVVNAQPTDLYPAIVYLSNRCTATFVGLNPPTAITARHCYEPDLAYRDAKVEKFIQSTIFDELYNPEGGPTTDIGVIVFSKDSMEMIGQEIKPHDLFLIGKSELYWGQKVQVCGFGRDGLVVYTGSDGRNKCAETSIVTSNSLYSLPKLIAQPLSDNLKNESKVNWAQLSNNEKSLYIHNQCQNFVNYYESDSKVCFAQFNDSAFLSPANDGYDETMSQPATSSGDSGGPMFIKSAGATGKNILIAIHTGGAALPDGSKRISLSFSWRIDRPWAQKLLQRAQGHGADLTIIK